MRINLLKELGILKRISEKDILNLMHQLDVLLEERKKERYTHKNTAAV